MTDSEPKISLDRITVPGSRLLVRVATSESVTPGGIFLPDNAKGRRFVATVKKVGMGVPSNLDVNPGDEVICGM